MKITSINGFIKLHRSILEWEWYDDINTFKLFIHCLLKANHQDNEWRGKLIVRGSFITSYENLSKETNLSVQNIRTSLNKLKSTHELTIKTSNKNTLISITNYEKYQTTNTQDNKQLTNNQQTTNKQLTTNKNIKKDKKDNNIQYADAFDAFWDSYPKQRAGSKEQAFKTYSNILLSNKTTIEHLLHCVKIYSKSDEVKKGYAKGCQAWLNAERYNDSVYCKKQLKAEEALGKYAVNPDWMANYGK